MQPERSAEALTLADLSKATGIPSRTIRYYIAQGLMDGPVTAGRTARYSEKHLEQLQAIRAAKQQGLTLGQIARHLAGSDAALSTLAPAPVEVFTLSPEITLLLRTNVPAGRLLHLRNALKILSEAIALQLPEVTFSDHP